MMFKKIKTKDLNVKTINCSSVSFEIMKKILTLILVLIGGLVSSYAQPYGNEWINYNQSYYKFRVYKDSIYRVPIANLTNLGLPSSVQGANLQIFKNGTEIPIYVSSNGSLTGTDYIEFYGERATGELDLPLFQNPSLQLNPDMSLLSDSSYYFITFNTSTTNKRFVERVNTIVSPPAKEDYIWIKLRNNYRNEFFSGESAAEGNTADQAHYELTSSQYETEGFVRKTTTLPDSVKFTLTNAYKISGAPDASFQTAVIGKSYFTHGMKVYAGTNLMADSSYGFFNKKQFKFNVPMSYANAANDIWFRYFNNPSSATYTDRFGISYLELRYPSTPNLQNKNGFSFELNPKTGSYYLEITNFATGGVAPRLYDLSTNEYLDGDISVSGQVRFLIPGSTTTKRLILQGQQTAAIHQVIGLEAITFKNFTQTNNQGNYLIITDPFYCDDGNGHNYVNDYVTYRASSAGGAYQPNIAYVNDLYNEFGYGCNYSSLALRNYLNFAYSSTQWTNKPKHLFIIGKGIDYNAFGQYSANKSSYPFILIPSFGEPSSDLLLSDFGKNNKPQISTGRLTCFNGTEVGNYLQKVQDYESVLANTTQTTDEKLWQKRFLHIAGTSDIFEQQLIVLWLNNQQQRISSPNLGAKVTLLKKSSTQEVETINSKLIDDMISTGVSFIQFFGHSSSSNIDYGLDIPENYSNYKKYYFFMANGCSAGDVFILTPAPLLSERFVSAPNKGAIGFIANVNTSFSDDLGIYTDSLYSHFGTKSFTMSIGEQMQRNVSSLMSQPGFANSFLFRIHTQQIQLNGDPAVHLYAYNKPDYAIEEKNARFRQLNLTTTVDSVDFDFVVHNIGRFIADSIRLIVKRKLPDNSESFMMNAKLPGFTFSDSFHIRIPTIGDAAVGLNALTLEIDSDFDVDEISENNNKIVVPFSIYNDDVVPVFPYNFSIVSAQDVELKGSTLNPYAASRKYIFQIDTTEKFNSTSLRTTSITSSGGVLKWKPQLTLKDSTVYYWRTAMDTLYGNQTHRWTTFSFIFLNQSAPGWNQSHTYQWVKNSFTDLYADSTNGELKFVGETKKIQLQDACMGGPLAYDFPDLFMKLNGVTLYNHGCMPSNYGSFQFIVIDSATGKLWQNYRPDTTIAAGRYGSYDPCRGGEPKPFTKDYFFEFSFKTQASRKLIMDFIDSIPDGNYIIAMDRICLGGGCGSRNTIFINQWKNDTTLLGSGNSLYHKLSGMGFTKIDSFTKNRPMIFWTQKNRPTTVQQFIGIDSTVKLTAEFQYYSSVFEGSMSSVKIGPAKNWSAFKKSSFSNDPNPTDSVTYAIYGVKNNGQDTLITYVTQDTTLAFIDAVNFPYLRLETVQTDNTSKTPEHLRYWRVLYTPIPEAALNPVLYSSFKDSLQQGEVLSYGVALENLTPYPMDSMLVSYNLIDKSGVQVNLGSKRYRPLAGNDTLMIQYDIPTRTYPKTNTLFIEANPNDDQVELYHPNNLALKSFYVSPDNKNPFLDVTFDGIHILDKDIVSAKPNIQITLTDDNRFLALDDTSLVEVFLKMPNSFNEERIPFDGTILKFYPAEEVASGKRNQAKLEFKPTLTDGDDYVLTVKAVDKTGNTTGMNEYKVGFEVVNQPSISSVLNYPNPFTTSTQFVFTLTGSEIPSNMKIQVLSVTGKVVREILQSELGPLHIGRNITEYKWKGDDQFGKPLGNGVYLYRVITNLHGDNMEHRKTDADKWFEKGFGKLYIMR